MRFDRLFTLCVIVALSLLNGIASSRGIVLRRQNEVSVTAPDRPSTTAAPQESAGVTAVKSASASLKPTPTSDKETSATQSTAKPSYTNESAPTLDGSDDTSECFVQYSDVSDELTLCSSSKS